MPKAAPPRCAQWSNNLNIKYVNRIACEQEKEKTNLHPRIIPIISNAINAPTPYWILIGYEGGMNNATSESGKASAVIVTAA